MSEPTKEYLEQIGNEMEVREIAILIAVVKDGVPHDVITAFTLINIGIKLMSKMNIPKETITKTLLTLAHKVEEGKY